MAVSQLEGKYKICREGTSIPYGLSVVRTGITECWSYRIGHYVHQMKITGDHEEFEITYQDLPKE